MSKRKAYTTYPKDAFELIKQTGKTPENISYILKLLKAIIEGDRSCLSLNIVRSGDTPDRSNACDTTNVNVIELICAKNLPLIHTACISGNPLVVKCLINEGVSVNSMAFNEYYGIKVGPIIYAILFGNSDVVELLIAKGANINEVICGRSLLDFAKVEKNKEIIKILEKAQRAEKASKEGFGIFFTDEKGLNILADVSESCARLPFSRLLSAETLDEAPKMMESCALDILKSLSEKRPNSTPSKEQVYKLEKSDNIFATWQKQGEDKLVNLTPLYVPTNPKGSTLQNPNAKMIGSSISTKL